MTIMNAVSPIEDGRDRMANREQRTQQSQQQQQQQDRRSKGKDAEAHTANREALPFSSAPSAPATIRPVLSRRTSSFSKRHASFDSPREVPLPYMPHRQPYVASTSTSQAQGSPLVHDSEPSSSTRLSCLASDARTDNSRSVYDDHVASSSSDSTPSSSSSPPTSSGSDSKTNRGAVPDYMDLSESPAPSTHFHSSRTMPPPRTQSPRIPSSSSNPVPLFSRPFSSPDASRPSQGGIVSPRPMRPPGVPDRGSTASLPLPAETPYHVLSAYPGGPIQEDQEMRSAAPSRPSSSRPSLGAHQGTTSSLPSSSSWQSRRSPTLVSDLEHEEFMSLVANRIFDRAYSCAARVDSDGSSSIMSDRPIPPPAPPTVLTPPPPPLSTDRGPTAPYEPFLAHAPPPQDSYIAVDTKPTEYRLIVRLPGFRRDAITVSTRKRRILHVVADSWEPNGGEYSPFTFGGRTALTNGNQFVFIMNRRNRVSSAPLSLATTCMQRISFGYDALLAQVRAEFDGEHLQVIVPRRMVPMTYHPSRD
ncbi:hypothetical protein C8Q73DRAFT_746465 [Cubamyces lactineus]|nr:hypothetical protein C8Q73DRAFT_746465 [Cubamyces lactineus]